MDDLYHRPNMFDGAIIHKLYPDIGIVFRGRVLQFDPSRRYWRIRYDVDNTESDFDFNDIVAFFNCSCTTALYSAKYVGQRRPNVFLTECNAHGSLLSPKHPIL
jgi:hypothetical protein